MSDPTLPPPVPSAAVPGRLARIEYLGFRDVGEYREFRLRSYSPDAATECLIRIPVAAFGDGRVRLQDGPDVCFQRLQRMVAAGEVIGADVITIDDDELVSYRVAHTKVAKHRKSWTPLSTPSPSDTTAAAMPARPMRPSPPPRPAVAVPSGPPPLEKGQRVSHAVFGEGVTASSSGGHTVVAFDEHGRKTFITSMLKVEVLSAPDTWETGPRGQNRPRRSPLAC